MRNNQNKISFWPSYVDVMTTLFAIMLVLFAVSFSRFRIKEKELEAFKDKYEEIMSIYSAVDNIDPEYFEFNEDYLKHIFKIQVNYQKGKYSLNQLKQDDIGSAYYDQTGGDSIRSEIKHAGEIIKSTILGLQENPSAKVGIKYLVVVEGQASADGYHNDDYYNNDVLSYLRAKKLDEYWREEGLDFSQMKGCELVIAGSGEKGVPRAQRLSPVDDSGNQRFLIHIVPVIGDIHLTP